MIKILTARYLGNFSIELTFSSGESGVFDGKELLKREGSLLVPLQNEAFFQRFFVDAGALAWPHGLELSPSRLYKQVFALQAA